MRFKAFVYVLLATTFHNFHFKEAGFQNARRDYKTKGLTRIEFQESSGIEVDQNSFWTHGDSGGSPNLAKFSFDGNLIDSAIIADATNNDWEDLTRDDKGNWFIGDFGNNQNERQDLRIYKIGGKEVEIIEFSWQDQSEFPPPKNRRNFDCEAFFWHESNLYLFSKNRSKGPVKAYILTDEPGRQIAQLIDKFDLHRMVTGADVNTSGTEFSLLCYGVIYTFDFSYKMRPFKTPKQAYRIGRGGQTEGIAYDGDSDFIVSNEAGRIFSIKRKN